MRTGDGGTSDSRAVADVIRDRSATNLFDAAHNISDKEIQHLAWLATRAPSAFNLQNWQLFAVRTTEMKAKLKAAAFHQSKVEEAAVTFVVCGERARADDIRQRLSPAVDAGLMNSRIAADWAQMGEGTYRYQPGNARDEAIRSATLLAATLMFAAEGIGWATGPMSGFDRGAVQELLGLESQVLPVLLLAIGRARPGNWPQKPRRPLHEVLTLL